MTSESFINCSSCDHPIQVPTLLQSLMFPEDVETIAALLEGTLNVITCPLCNGRVPLPIPMAAINAEYKSVVAAVPENNRDEVAMVLSELPEDWIVKYCNNYVELYSVVASWINLTVTPVIAAVCNGSLFNQPNEEQVRELSPLTLRVFKAQVDGKLIEPIIRFEGAPDHHKLKSLILGLYNETITGLIGYLLDTAVKEKAVPSLDSTIRAHIPPLCITAEVLANALYDCSGLINPWEDQTGFRKGFLREYLNAILHSHSGSENPRRKRWAAYLYAIWKLSCSTRVTLDNQFTLSSETIRRTASFHELWDIAMQDRSGQSGDMQYLFADAEKMMRQFGFQAEFEEVFARLPISIQAPEADSSLQWRLSQSFLNVLKSRYSFNENPDQSIELGGIVGGAIESLLNNGQKQAAIILAEEMLRLSLESTDYFATFAISTRVTEALNKAEEYEVAERLMAQVMPLIKNPVHMELEATKPSLMLDFFNEMGNVFRYKHRYEHALTAYDLVEKIYKSIPPDKQNYKNMSVLNRNRAIVYRGMGKYRTAKNIFASEVESNPDDHALLFSLAMLYLETNDFRQASQYLDEAIRIAEEKMFPHEQAEYLLTRGILKHALGENEGGLADLIGAYEVSTAIKSRRALRIAAAAIRFQGTTSSGREFIDKCLKELDEEIKSKRQRGDPSLLMTMIIGVAEKYLDEGKSQELFELLQPEFEWLDRRRGDFPWQYDYVRGWLAYQLGQGIDCWRHFETALRKINSEVPGGENVSFSPSWMYDKDQFQHTLSTVAVELVRNHLLSSIELLMVYEITNGREISARLGTFLPPEDITSTIKELAEVVNREVSLFFPIIDGDFFQLCQFSSSSDTPHVIEGARWSREAIRQIRTQTYQSFKQANPGDLSVLDASIQIWEKVSSEFGEIVARYTHTSSHVCFLPGRDLTGLPLHLIKMPDGTKLIEKNTVSFAPNFAVLLAEAKGVSSYDGEAALITVTKRRDSERFRSRALEASREIKDILYQQHKVQEFTELKGSKKNVIEILPHVSQVFFLCHGAYAGSQRGYGVCVADERQLPPSLFPIQEMPDLDRFILTWEELNDVEPCPLLVVSIACSSGLTEVVKGGTRHGLEQTLFGHGTRTLITPLWDIDQQAALMWVTRFCQIRAQYPEKRIVDIYKETSLAVKEHFPHPFFWGSFTVNGSLFLEDRR